MEHSLLTITRLERYARHLRLAEVGPEGQARLLQSKVLVVGAGGLGSPAALYLVAAGVGTLGLVDDDRVSLSNLQRQVLYTEADLGQLKAEAARRRLSALNPDVRVVTHPIRLTAENATSILAGYDLVVNGSDNFPTRYLLSDACVLAGKPLVDGSVLGFTGQVTSFLPGRGCYRCLYPAPPPPGAVRSCAEAGVLGALVGQIGAMQAMEAIKLLLGIGESLAGRLLLIDALAGETEEIHWARNPSCRACGDEPDIRDVRLVNYPAFCGLAPAAQGAPEGWAAAGFGSAEDGGSLPRNRTAPGLLTPDRVDISPADLHALLQEDRVLLVDVREPWEFAMHRLAGARLMPFSRFSQHVGEIDPDRDVVVVCECGERSRAVTDALRRAGLPRVYNLEGGMAAWLAQDLPVERGAL